MATSTTMYTIWAEATQNMNNLQVVKWANFTKKEASKEAIVLPANTMGEWMCLTFL